jgi:hypothetical protein
MNIYIVNILARKNYNIVDDYSAHRANYSSKDNVSF